MSIDLERSLADLARSVHDDDLADRLNGQVHRMVTQVRRRRAIRSAGTGVVGVGAAAVVVVGGGQLLDRPGILATGAARGAADAAEDGGTDDAVGEMPAGEGEGAAPDDDAQAALERLLAAAAGSAEALGVCGSAVGPDLDAPVVLEVALENRAYAPGESVATQIQVRASDDVPQGARLTANRPQVVLARDGVVVGLADEPFVALPIALAPDRTGTVPATAAFTLCTLPGTDPSPEGALGLPAGTYQAYGVFTLTVEAPTADGVEPVPWEPVVVRSAPVEVTVG